MVGDESHLITVGQLAEGLEGLCPVDVECNDAWTPEWLGVLVLNRGLHWV